MALKPLDPAVAETLCPGWDITAAESGRSDRGLQANLLLTNGDPHDYRILDLGDTDAQADLIAVYASKTGLDEATVLKVLLKLIVAIEGATRARDKKARPSPQEQEYHKDGDGLWLVTHGARGDERRQLTNFAACIVADVIEDDGTPETRRFFEL